jgi:plasmid stability protein
MPVNLSIKNAPDDLAEALRERAKRNHRSLQDELIASLEAMVKTREATPVDVLSEVRRISLHKPADILAKVRRLGVRTPSESAELIHTDRNGR